MKKKKDLLIDKKECSSCGTILEKNVKVCDECGYDMSIEEGCLNMYKQYIKFLNEQTAPPKEYEYNPKEDPGNVKQITTTKTSLRNLKPGSVVNVTADENKNSDEGKKKKDKNNPWAICTASVGRKDKKKFERCVLDVKERNKMDEDLKRVSEYIERIITDSEIKPKIKKGNFKNFISKLK